MRQYLPLLSLYTRCCCCFSFLIIVPPSALSLSITPMGDPIAGNAYTIVCLASISSGIQSTPIFSWYNSDGQRISSGGGLVVGPPTATSLPLSFGVLMSAHSGVYTCRATLFSLALQAPLNDSASTSISVQRKYKL